MIKTEYQYQFSSDGNIIVIGAENYKSNSNSNIGYVRIYEYSEISSDWEQIGNSIIGELTGDKSVEDYHYLVMEQ